MDISGSSAVVTGAASGIGAAVARRLAAAAATVVIADVQDEKGQALADELGGAFAHVDVTDTAQITAAIDAAGELAPLRVLVNSAGIGPAARTVGRDGTYESAHDLDLYKRVIAINLIGTFDATRIAGTAMSRLEPLASGERGAIVNLASVAAFDGQIGQAAYSSSKGGIVGMTLPVARDPRRDRGPRQHRGTRSDRHPDLRRGREGRGVQGAAGGVGAVPPAARHAGRARRDGARMPDQLLHERCRGPRRRRHPDAPEVAGMRAVVVEQPGGPEALAPTTLPAPTPGPGEVVVEVEAVGVNPVDCGNRADPSWATIETPYVVGYEFSGRVAGSGEEVWGLLPVRGTRWGALAEQVVVQTGLVAPRPPGLDAVSAAALPLAGCTALQVLERLGLPEGSWLLVHGAAGGVGHLLVQLAVRRGLRVAAASRPEDRGRLEALGVELWLDRAVPDPAAAATQALGHDVDAVADLVGGLLEPSLAHVRIGGHAATIVDLSGDLDLAIDRNLDLHGVLMRAGADRLDALALEVAAGVRPTVVATYPLERTADAHRRLEAGKVGGKLVVTG